jgi:SulP family sulfate permease
MSAHKTPDTELFSPPRLDASTAQSAQSSAAAAWMADFRAGIVVFLVALPLCLGIAMASGAPPFAGLIAGIVGGVVVAMAGGCALSVAGPAAGMVVIVLSAIERLGFTGLLMATVLAGALQVVAGVFRFGRFARMVPFSVIRGMLAAIGILLLTRQLPVALGYTKPTGGSGAAGGLEGVLSSFHLGPLTATAMAAAAMFLWRDYGKLKLSKIMPRELAAVLAGIACYVALSDSALALQVSQRVTVPLFGAVSLNELWARPDFSSILRPEIWTTAGVIAIVASIESLLCVEATDKADPQRRITNPDRELVGQGLGNLGSGLLGGLPVTAVVVRSFTNIQAGARTKRAAIVHGILLLAATVLLGSVLNTIPLAALAVVLIVIAYKLSPPKLYLEMWRKGRDQFVPFFATVVLVVSTDLMTGTLLGVAVALAITLWKEHASAVVVVDDGAHRVIRFASNIWFLHKMRLREALFSALTADVRCIVLDGTRARWVDPDVLDVIREFGEHASARGVELLINRSHSAFVPFFRPEGST